MKLFLTSIIDETQPHHELYRQWVAVHDHLNHKDHGIQGFLLVSITVIGPGDTFLVHDREAEIAKELADAAATAAQAAEHGSSGATTGNLYPESQSLVLLPPNIELKLHFLVVKVFKAGTSRPWTRAASSWPAALTRLCRLVSEPGSGKIQYYIDF
jgi:hypothetical protein